jgi:hypothetical protein
VVLELLKVWGTMGKKEGEGGTYSGRPRGLQGVSDCSIVRAWEGGAPCHLSTGREQALGLDVRAAATAVEPLKSVGPPPLFFHPNLGRIPAMRCSLTRLLSPRPTGDFDELARRGRRRC